MKNVIESAISVTAVSVFLMLVMHTVAADRTYDCLMRSSGDYYVADFRVISTAASMDCRP